MSFDLYEIQVAAGPLVLHEETVIGVVVDDTYVFNAGHATLDDIDDFEVSGTGYERLEAEARNELADGVWRVWFDDVTTTDLSDVPARAGIVWMRPSEDLIGFSADPGGAIDPYEPTYPSGAFDYPIQAINAILTQLRADVDVALAATGGLSVVEPLTLTEGELALALGDGLSVDSGNLVAEGGGEFSDFGPMPLGATDPGVLELASRGDHVHEPPAVEDLVDVAITAPQIGDVLTFDGTNWINEAP